MTSLSASESAMISLNELTLAEQLSLGLPSSVVNNEGADAPIVSPPEQHLLGGTEGYESVEETNLDELRMVDAQNTESHSLLLPHVVVGPESFSHSRRISRAHSTNRCGCNDDSKVRHMAIFLIVSTAVIVVVGTIVTLSSLAATMGSADTRRGFRVASYYASNMVLQRPPARPRIWGYADNAGDLIVVALETGSQTLYDSAINGPDGEPTWEVTFQPITVPGPHNITIKSSRNITLTNILIGDVWVCSGQSNMEHQLDRIDNPQPDIDDAVNYPNIRTFTAGLEVSDVPLNDLLSINRNWAIPTADNIGSFSAVCWLFGRDLYRKYGRPIGLIATWFGGTRIEAWSSPDALKKCFTPVSIEYYPNEKSQLFNAMINPFISMSIFGVIWYQGESNMYNSHQYACAIKAMIDDWRTRWFKNCPEMNRIFPFGQVQLAPWRDQDIAIRFPDIRWAQTDGFGYVPNTNMTKTFIAIAIDLPDFNSPYNGIHPRYKRQIANRLALAAFNVAYGSNDTGIYQGPRPIRYAIDGANVRVTYDVDIKLRSIKYANFELCCGAAPTATCGAGGRWVGSNLAGSDARSVALTNTCNAGESVTGYRYLWRESPCALLNCPVYSVENSLPAPPFVFNGVIA